MRFFKKTRKKLLKIQEDFYARLAEISRNTGALNLKMDELDIGEGTAIKIYEEIINTKEFIVELKDEMEGMGKIMAEFIKLESKMIEKMSKFFDLETKATERDLSTTPPEPTEHDKVF